MERYFEISEALIKSGGVVWDNHNGGSEIKLHGLAALVAGDKVVTVGLLKADFFSLNRVFLQDDKVHLSVDSVGGTLFPVNFKDLWDCINDYNEKQVNNKFSCGTLENVMSLIPVPVTVITMTVAEFNERVRITGERLAVAKELLEVTADEPADDAEGVATLSEALGSLPTGSLKHLISTVESIPKEEANKQFVSRRSAERITMLNDTFDQGAKIVGTPNPDDEYVHLKLGELPIDSQRKLTSLNVDFLPGDENEIQEAYYREMLAKKETGVVPTEDLGKEIPFVAGYAGHKDPSKP